MTNTSRNAYEEWKNRNKSQAAAIRNRAQNKSNFKRPRWAIRMDDRWDFRKQPFPVRVIFHRQPDGKIFFPFYEAWITTARGQRPVISNSHDGAHDVPDLLDYYMVQEDNDELKPQLNYAVSMTVLETFHVVKTKRKKNDKEYEDTKYELCTADPSNPQARCEHCDNGVETTFGRRVYFKVWPRQRTELITSLEKYGTMCSACGEGQVATTAYLCPNCEEPFITAEDEPNGLISLDNIEYYEGDFSEDPQTCPHCKAEWTHATAIEECRIAKKGRDRRSITWKEGCDDPTPMEPVDGEIVLGVVKAGRSTIPVIEEVLTRSAEALEDLDKYKLEGHDLFELYGWEELDDQARNLGRENPWKGDNVVNGILEAHVKEQMAKRSSHTEDYDDNDEGDGHDVEEPPY